jgi:capsular polysaccharide biosynthesis protein
MDEQGAQRLPDENATSLLDYWRVIWARRNLIGAICAISMLVSFVYSLFLPKIYRTTASILPPTEIGIGGGSQISLNLGGGGVGGFSIGLPESKGLFSLTPSTPTRDTFVAILKSRSMREEVIGHFSKGWGPSVGSLIGAVDITNTKEGVMLVVAESRHPKLAAEVANFYFNNLSQTLARRGKISMKVQLDYYEGKLDQARRDLKEAQDSLVEFQERYRYIGLDPATKGAIATGAAEAGGVMALEMERAIKRSYLTDSHPEMIAMDRRIYEAKRLISHQLYGEAQPLPPESPGAPPRKEFFVASAKLTPLQFKLADVYRNLKFREALWSHIITNIEALKYTSDNPTSIHIDWLDPAVPPRKPFSPNIGYNVGAAGIGALVIGIFIAFFLEYLERQKASERLQRAEVHAVAATAALGRSRVAPKSRRRAEARAAPENATPNP